MLLLSAQKLAHISNIGKTSMCLFKWGQAGSFEKAFSQSWSLNNYILPTMYYNFKNIS